MKPEDVSSFWLAAGPNRWFNKDAAFDGELSIRFRSALAEARLGAFDHWGETPDGALGLVLLLDQVSRNVHRNSPLAFAADRKALALAKSWIGRNYHHALPAPIASWFILPYEHAEDLDAQHRGVALFQSLGLAEMVYWAQIHLDIIAKFTRFPHRNAILGRISTPEEIAFLRSGGFAG
jgi:uncharacterized protein (DUF924 family)